MGINLQKGQSINLSKYSASELATELRNLHVGLGWDVNKSVTADLDAFILVGNATGKVTETISFSRKVSSDRAIQHLGDNLTGVGEGDDEVILIDLQKLDRNTESLLVGVTVYQARVPFSKVDNAFIRLVNKDTNQELTRFNLSEDKGNNYSLILGQIIKNQDGTWTFNTAGVATEDRTIDAVRNRVSR